MTKMNVCLVSQEFPPETPGGGIGSQSVQKAQGMISRGHEVTVISCSTSGERSVAQMGSLRVVRIPGYSRPSALNTEPARWLAYSMAVAGEIQRLRDDSSFDIIDFPEWACEGLFFLLNRPDWDRMPAVIQLHGSLAMLAEGIGWPPRDSELYRIGSFFERTSLRLADRVYSSSRFSANWCERAYGISASEIPVIHTGVDTSHFTPRQAGGTEMDGPVVLFAGRIDESKGVFDILDACCQMAQAFPRLQLHLIGRDPNGLAGRLQERAMEFGCPTLLKILGPIDRQKLPEYFRNATVFAVPSHYEGGPGFVYLEAKACGLPVIGCSGSGIEETIRNGEDGLLVAPRDVTALTDALRHLLHDQQRREAMGKAARARVLLEADSQACLDRLESFYRETIACGRKKGGMDFTC